MDVGELRDPKAVKHFGQSRQADSHVLTDGVLWFEQETIHRQAHSRQSGQSQP
jgi:hypothetical protein